MTDLLVYQSELASERVLITGGGADVVASVTASAPATADVLTAADVPTALRQLYAKSPEVIVYVAQADDEQPTHAIHALRHAPGADNVGLLVLHTATHAEQVDLFNAAGADLVLPVDADQSLLRSALQAARKLCATRCELREAADQRGRLTHTLMTFVEYSIAISDSVCVDAILEQTLYASLSATQCRFAAVLLRTETPDEMVVARTIGRELGPIGARRREADLIAAMRQTAPSTTTSVSRDGVPRHAALVPLFTAEGRGCRENYGVLHVSGSVAVREFDDLDLQVLELIASRAVTAVRRSLSRFWAERARDALVKSLVELTEARDDNTGAHIDRVTANALMLARCLARREEFQDVIDDEFLEALRRATPLHDVGKIAVPDAVMLKPGSLTPEERSIIQTHTVVGGDALRSAHADLPQSASLRMAEDIARFHHEWFNGEGYPTGRSSAEIPLAARIVAVADVYDALRSARPYKPGIDHETAFRLITERRGTQFDPMVVDAFVQLQEDFRRCFDVPGAHRAIVSGPLSPRTSTLAPDLGLNTLAAAFRGE